VPENKKIRVIVNTDAKNEADDQFAIVHACLTPKFQIQGLIAAHFGNHRSNNSMEESYQECLKLVDLMKLPDEIACFRGAKTAVASPACYEYSEGAQLIVREALADDQKPLFVIFLGPLTDLACAYLHNPEIAGRLTAIWIGGGAYPKGGIEFNLRNDIEAANIILQSEIELWQVPSNVYSRMLTSFAELQDRVQPHGEIGQYLFRQMLDFNQFCAEKYTSMAWPRGESWSLGDSPAVGLMLDPQDYAWTSQEAPQIDQNMNYHFDGNGRAIRVYHDINVRFILEDMFYKLKLFYGGRKDEA